MTSFALLRWSMYLPSRSPSLGLAFILAMVIATMTSSTSTLELLAPHNVCKGGTVTEEPSLSKKVQSLLHCKNVCLHNNQCVALEFYNQTSFCRVYSKFCNSPFRANGNITVYRAIRQSPPTTYPNVTTVGPDTSTSTSSPATATINTTTTMQATTIATTTQTTSTISATAQTTSTISATAQTTSTTTSTTTTPTTMPAATGTTTATTMADTTASKTTTTSPGTTAMLTTSTTASTVPNTTMIVTADAKAHCDALGRCVFCAEEDQFLSPCVTLVSRSITRHACETAVLDATATNNLLNDLQQLLVARGGLSRSDFRLAGHGGARGRVRCGSVVATLSLASVAAAQAAFAQLQRKALSEVRFGGGGNLSFASAAYATTTTTVDPVLSALDFVFWPWRQLGHGADSEDSEALLPFVAVVSAYALALLLLLLAPVTAVLACRCCCFTSRCCCCKEERSPLAVVLCPDSLACVVRMAKCCCASSALAPAEAALPALWRTNDDFHAFGKSMYKYQTAAFGGAEDWPNESKSGPGMKPKAVAPSRAGTAAASNTQPAPRTRATDPPRETRHQGTAAATSTSTSTSAESRQRRRDERRAKRGKTPRTTNPTTTAARGGAADHHVSLELAVIHHPPAEAAAAWGIGVDLGTRFVTIQFEPDCDDAPARQRANALGLRLHSAVMNSRASPSGASLSYWKRLLVADNTRDRLHGTPWVSLFEATSANVTATARSVVPEALEAIGAAILEQNLPARAGPLGLSLPSYLLHLVKGQPGQDIWRWDELRASVGAPRVTVCTDAVSAMVTYATSPAAAVHKSSLAAGQLQQVFFVDVGYGFTSSAGCQVDLAGHRLHMLQEQCIPCGCLDIVDNTFRHAFQQVESARESVGLPTLADIQDEGGPALLLRFRERFQAELQAWATELLTLRFRKNADPDLAPTTPDTRDYLRQRKRLFLLDPGGRDDAYYDMAAQQSAAPTSIAITAREFYSINREYFLSITESVCDTFRACDFRSPPTILVGGTGRPQVPLILTKLSTRLKALRGEVMAQHSPGAKVGVNQTVCLGDVARGAAIVAMLRHSNSAPRHPAARWADALQDMRGVVDLS